MHHITDVLNLMQTPADVAVQTYLLCMQWCNNDAAVGAVKLYRKNMVLCGLGVEQI